MLSTLTSLNRSQSSFIWFLIFTFTLSSMPHLEMLIPYRIHFSVKEAYAEEAVEEAPADTSPKEAPPPEEKAPSDPEGEAAAAQSGETEALEVLTPAVSFKVDDFTGAAHMSYPIAVPPGRNGLAPRLSLGYSSSGGNGWIGVGWDLSAGFIQRRGPRKGVPTYDDSKDVFELQLGGGAPQELVCTSKIGNTWQFQLKIEGAYLKITYYAGPAQNNYWLVYDKSGLKMRFGYSDASRLNRTQPYGTGIYRWCLDRVEDAKTNYMEILYQKPTGSPGQIYLERIRYNGEVAGALPYNHEVIFVLDSGTRTDPIYNYRGGFQSLTLRRLSSIEIKTNGANVRKYTLQYSNPNVRSLLWKITLYGNDFSTTLQPPTTFTYQAMDMQAGPEHEANRGFNSAVDWSNPSAWGDVGGNYIRNNYYDGDLVYGTQADVMDMNGDGLPDRIVRSHGSSPYPWKVYLNTGSGFALDPITWWETPEGSSFLTNLDEYGGGTKADLLDMDGDSLPDRVVSPSSVHPHPHDPWLVYFNLAGEELEQEQDIFGPASNWANPSVWEVDSYHFGYYIRDNIPKGAFTEVIDLNGDGLVDRVVYDKDNPYTTWTVYFGNGSTGFNTQATPNWSNPSYEIWGPTVYDESNLIRRDQLYRGTRCDLIDMNGDGLPDRVCYAHNFSTERKWRVYFNTGSGFDASYILWANTGATTSLEANHIRHKKWDVFDINGDGLPDRVLYDKDYNCADPPNCPAVNWKVYLNMGNKFSETKLTWPNPSPWNDTKGNYIRSRTDNGTFTDVFDIDGDGLPDRVVYDREYTCPNPEQGCPAANWQVYRNKGPVPDLLSRVDNSIHGSTSITYRPSTDYANTFLPMVVQTVKTYTVTDGRQHSYTTEYEYSGGYYDPDTVEFRGFGSVKACQPNCSPQGYESMTETIYNQDYYKKGRVQSQVQISKEGHWRQVVNNWEDQDLGNGIKFSKLNSTTSTIRDCEGGDPYTDCQGEQSHSYSYKHRTSYQYDLVTFDVLREDKEHEEGEDVFRVDIRTYFTYTSTTYAGTTCAQKWILSKPTEIRVMKITYPPPEEELVEEIFSRKWMDYDCSVSTSNGNIIGEEVCKSNTPNDPITGCVNRNATQNPVITYVYYDRTSYPGYGPLKEIRGPREADGQVTSMTYDSTWTHVYQTTNCKGHVTTTEFDLGTGNLKKLIPPHLQGSTYSILYTYDKFGRKERVDRPDGGWTSYDYSKLGAGGDPANNTQYIEKTEHIVGGVSSLDHKTYTYLDGMGRNYKTESTGPDGVAGKRIVTETHFDSLGRVSEKCNPWFSTDPVECQHSTKFPLYDGFARLNETITPDNYTITTTYQGLTKKVTNQRGYSTWYTYDIYQRLLKVREPNDTYTEYSYDTLGNLLEVRAAKNASGGNLLGPAVTTTMTYDSLSKKTTMIDPDMGTWSYTYDKSGNLMTQTDAKGQTIEFEYDCLNRVEHKIYRMTPPDPDHIVNYYYDSQVNSPPPGIPNIAKGKLWRVYDSYEGDTSEDLVVEFGLMQNVAKSRKIIGIDTSNIEQTYDSAGRVVTLKYLAGQGFSTDKIYSYEYDSAGNTKYLKDNGTGANLVAYTDYTPVGQPRYATFPNPGGAQVKTDYTYYPETTRLHTLLTRQIGGAGETFQNLDYQQYDEVGNIVTLRDNFNNFTHAYVYDSLNRMTSAHGTGTPNPYHEIYTYDVIGNIDSKQDVLAGTTYEYIYTYSNKPHAVSRVEIGGQNKFTFEYDANGNMTNKTDVPAQTVWTMAYNHDNKPTSITKGATTVTFTYDGNGQRVKKENSSTVFYFGGGFEVRNGVGVIHLNAGNKRIASVRSDGNTQFYHSNHLGSASVVTNQLGVRKEVLEYLPFGDYRVRIDDAPGFPNVNYTFTGQEDDDELGFYNYGARLYDPVIGRFISPDRIVQAPQNPQTLNRYSYCINNPLVYTDPSGEYFDPFTTAIIVGAIMGAFGGAANANVEGGSWLKGAAIGAVIGAASGAAGYGVGQLVGSWATYALTWVIQTTSPAYGSAVGVIAATAGGFAGGAVGGGLNAAVYGGSIWKGALYGGLTAAAMAATVQGIIQLGNSVNGASSTGQAVQGENITQETKEWFDNPSEIVTNNQGLDAAKQESIRAAHEALSADEAAKYTERMNIATFHRTITNIYPPTGETICGWAELGGTDIWITPKGFSGSGCGGCLAKTVFEEGMHLIGYSHKVIHQDLLIEEITKSVVRCP